MLSCFRCSLCSAAYCLSLNHFYTPEAAAAQNHQESNGTSIHTSPLTTLIAMKDFEFFFFSIMLYGTALTYYFCVGFHSLDNIIFLHPAASNLSFSKAWKCILSYVTSGAISEQN